MVAKNEAINVTEPFLPPLEEFAPYLEDIWKRRWLTNNGYYHQALEAALAEYLQVPFVSLFNNATVALLVGLRALGVAGEVITTPFSFVATAHSILWAGLTPVFADIDPLTFNLSPAAAAKFVNGRTGAIVPVHCYGTPCDIDAFDLLSKERRFPILYDAAHAFGVSYRGQSILTAGDLSVLSFHATKVFNTFEGGAIISHDAKQKARIDNLKNFGIVDELTVVDCGINGKMNEFQAAFGLLQLRYVDKALTHRRALAQRYRELLYDVPGIVLVRDMVNVCPNGGYFPILVSDGIDARDSLFNEYRKNNIGCRRYFYPLISNMSLYQKFRGAARSELPVANSVADRVICLPIHPQLSASNVEFICDITRAYMRTARSSPSIDWRRQETTQ